MLCEVINCKVGNLELTFLPRLLPPRTSSLKMLNKFTDGRCFARKRFAIISWYDYLYKCLYQYGIPSYCKRSIPQVSYATTGYPGTMNTQKNSQFISRRFLSRFAAGITKPAFQLQPLGRKTQRQHGPIRHRIHVQMFPVIFDFMPHSWEGTGYDV